MGHNRLVSFTGEVLLHLHLPTQPFNGKEKTMFDKLKGLVIKNPSTTTPDGATNAIIGKVNDPIEIGPGTMSPASSPLGKLLEDLEIDAA